MNDNIIPFAPRQEAPPTEEPPALVASVEIFEDGSSSFWLSDINQDDADFNWVLMMLANIMKSVLEEKKEKLGG